MLDLIYITHLQQGKQKNLAYALKLAKAFSSPLSLLPSSRLDAPQKGKILIWRPNYEEKRGRIGKKKLPVFLLGKSSSKGLPNVREHQIVQQLIDQGFPIFLLPFSYSFNRITNVLFMGNAPGLTDHPVNHQIAATFLPRAFKLEDSKLKKIHWNNICNITESSWPASTFSSLWLNTNIQRHAIDLAVLPITEIYDSPSPHISGKFPELFLYKNPILLVPLFVKKYSSQQGIKSDGHPISNEFYEAIEGEVEEFSLAISNGLVRN